MEANTTRESINSSILAENFLQPHALNSNPQHVLQSYSDDYAFLHAPNSDPHDLQSYDYALSTGENRESIPAHGNDPLWAYSGDMWAYSGA